MFFKKYVEAAVDLVGYSVAITLFPGFGVVCLHCCKNIINSHTAEFTL
jgi:hypothetical protein